MKKPVAIVTKSGDTVSMSALDGYVLSARTKQLPEDMFTSVYGTHGLVQPYYSLERLAYLPEVNTYHGNCVRVKAQDVVSEGWELMPAERVTAASEAQLEVAESVLKYQATDLAETLRRALTDYEAIGNGYIECGRRDDQPDGPVVFIAHVPGQTVRVHQGFNKFCQIRGLRKAWFKAFGYEKDITTADGAEWNPGTRTDRANELIQIVQYTNRSDYYGLPETLAAVGAMLGSALSRDFNMKFFENFGVPAYVVSVSGDYDLGEADENGKYEIQKYVEQHFRKLKREPHSNLILMVPSETGGKVEVEITPLAVDVKEASFRLYRRDNRDEILSAHRVPPYRVGITETGSLGGSTAEASDKFYIQSIINPRQKMIERIFNRQILPTLGVTDWEFHLRELDLEQEGKDRETADFMVRNGAMTPNQLIRYFGPRFGLEPSEDPALDEYYMNGVPVGQARFQGGLTFKGEEQAIGAIKQFHERLEQIARKD